MIVALDWVIAVSTTATDQSGGPVDALGDGAGAASTMSESMFGPPPAVVAVTRTALLPARSGATTDWVAQVVQPPLGGKVRVATSAPLTVTLVGRSAVVPFAYRTIMVALRASADDTVHSTELPTSFA